MNIPDLFDLIDRAYFSPPDQDTPNIRNSIKLELNSYSRKFLSNIIDSYVFSRIFKGSHPVRGKYNEVLNLMQWFLDLGVAFTSYEVFKADDHLGTNRKNIGKIMAPSSLIAKILAFIKWSLKDEFFINTVPPT